MIRFVKIEAEEDVLTDDDGNGVAGFAWFDTVTDHFVTVYDEQVWQTWEEFKRAWMAEYGDEPDGRFYSLFPPNSQP